MLASFLLAVVPSVLLLVVPTYSTASRSLSITPAGRVVVTSESGSESLVEREGGGLAAVLAVPVGIAGVPMVIRRGRARIASRTVAAGLLCFGVVITGFSLGLFYLPSAALMVVAAFGETPASAGYAHAVTSPSVRMVTKATDAGATSG